jgi:hypothetical protein
LSLVESHEPAKFIDPVSLLLLASMIIYGADSARSAPKPRAGEHIVVELTVKGFWDAEKVVVPVDRHKCVAGFSMSGGSDVADNRSANYSVAVAEVRKHKAIVRLRVVINASKPVDIKLTVIKGAVRQYEFERGIKVTTYYAGDAADRRPTTRRSRPRNSVALMRETFF